MTYQKLFKLILIISLLVLTGLTMWVKQAQAASISTETISTHAVDVTPDQTPALTPFNLPLLQSSPALTITKSADTQVNAGEVLTYTIVVANSITDATGTVITDYLDSNVSFAWASDSGTHNAGVVSWNTGTITQAQTLSRTLAVTVGSNIPAGTIITNTVEITSTEGVSDSHTIYTTVEREVDLVISKTDSPDPATLILPVRYTLNISNNGPSDATGVVVTDTLPAGASIFPPTSLPSNCSQLGQTITCDLGTIPNGQNKTVILDNVYFLTPGIYTNRAGVTANEPDSDIESNVATENTTVQPANLLITKTDSPDPVFVQDSLTYTINVINNGPYPATNLVVTDKLPAGVLYRSASSAAFTCNESGGTVTCDLTYLSNFDSKIITLIVTPTVAGLITNTVQVSADQPDPSPANNTFTQTTTVKPVTDLTIGKSANPEPVVAGEILTYSLTITNYGPSNATTGITVTDSLPAGVTFDSGAGCSANGAGAVVTCTLSSLDKDDNYTFDITVNVDPAKRGTLSNQANVTGAEYDPNTGNNTSNTLVTNVIGKADLTISKRANAATVVAGESFTYTLTITNNGPSTANAITVTDSLPAGVTFNSGAGCSASGTGTVVTCTLNSLAVNNDHEFEITVDVDSNTTGTLYNQATVDASESDLNEANDTSNTVVTPVTRQADLSIDKTDQKNFVTAGDPVTYTLTVFNNGPSDTAGVTVTDTLPANVSLIFKSAECGPLTGGKIICDLGSLPKGATKSVTIAITTTTTETVSITNIASVGSDAADPNSDNNTDNEETTINPVSGGGLTQVFLPIIMKEPPTLLYIENDTGGQVTFTVFGAASGGDLVCVVPTGNQNFFCGSFPSGTYTVQAQTICGTGTSQKTYGSGYQSTRVYCN